MHVTCLWKQRVIVCGLQRDKLQKKYYHVKKKNINININTGNLSTTELEQADDKSLLDGKFTYKKPPEGLEDHL